MFWSFQKNFYDTNTKIEEHKSMLNWNWYPENLHKTAQNIKYNRVLVVINYYWK